MRNLGIGILQIYDEFGIWDVGFSSYVMEVGFGIWVRFGIWQLGLGLWDLG